MKKLAWIAVSVMTVAAFSGCDLLIDEDDRFVGVIGYESLDHPAQQHDQRGAPFPSKSTGSDRMPDCPDHVALLPLTGDCVLTAPDSVEAGVRFSATIRTSGQLGCTAPAGSEISTTPSMIEVVPYDRRGPTCADAYGMIPRTVELAFPDPGHAVIRVTGRILIVGDSVVDERMKSIDHPVVVR